MPRTICQYYWKFVWNLILLPLTIPILLIGTVFKTIRGDALRAKTVLFWAYNIVSFISGFLFYNEDPEIPYNQSFFITWLVGFGIWTAIMLTIILIVLIALKISDRNQDKRRARLQGRLPMNKTSIIVLQFKAWKEKNCPLINWRP